MAKYIIFFQSKKNYIIFLLYKLHKYYYTINLDDYTMTFVIF